jgi:hypothetical protein
MRNSIPEASATGVMSFLLPLVLFAAAVACSGPEAQAEIADAPDSEAQALVHDLLSQRPTKDISIHGMFKVRRGNGRTIAIPVASSIHLSEQPWESVYENSPTPTLGRQQLVIVHHVQEPNQYRLTQCDVGGSITNSQTLLGASAQVPFAGTDFWISDLGLEFLHWPGQRMVRDAKITMRLGRPCKVLESSNPTSEAGAYSRVVSWVDSESGGLIRAEAYDRQGKRFKVFSLHGFTKVNGHWQVKDMELQNDKADSKTVLEFSFDDAD